MKIRKTIVNYLLGGATRLNNTETAELLEIEKKAYLKEARTLLEERGKYKAQNNFSVKKVLH